MIACQLAYGCAVSKMGLSETVHDFPEDSKSRFIRDGLKEFQWIYLLWSIARVEGKLSSLQRSVGGEGQELEREGCKSGGNPTEHKSM